MADIVPASVVQTNVGKVILPPLQLTGQMKKKVAGLVQSHLENLFVQVSKVKPGLEVEILFGHLKSYSLQVGLENSANFTMQAAPVRRKPKDKISSISSLKVPIRYFTHGRKKLMTKRSKFSSRRSNSFLMDQRTGLVSR